MLIPMPMPPRMTDPRDDSRVVGPYVTRLSFPEESAFQQWIKTNKVPWQDTPTADYDMRGFWKALQAGDPRAKTAVSTYDNRMHFPDVWKTPYHKSFSNESIYATDKAPKWIGDRLVDRLGSVLADESK